MLNKVLVVAGLIWLGLLAPSSLQAHVYDEMGVKAQISFTQAEVLLSFKIWSGLLFSNHFLETLDPDQNRSFAEQDRRAFAELFAASLSLGVNGRELQPQLLSCEASDWETFAAGVSTISLDYAVPYQVGAGQEADFAYEISFFPDIAVYTLDIRSAEPLRVGIIAENRNEFLQDKVSLTLSQNPAFLASLPINLYPRAETGNWWARAQAYISGSMERFGFYDFVRGEQIDSSALLLLLGLAIFVGFLHAFTPGHGKALVGAFLIANHGKLRHALLIGLIIAVTHTFSIFAFGLVIAKAQNFLPGVLIAKLNLICAVLIIGIGLNGLARRLTGTAREHAHLLPNLQIFGRDTVNILIDGQAADAVEALGIAGTDDEIMGQLAAVGASDFNLCTPGCSAHGRLPRFVRDLQTRRAILEALKTGAVDAVITFSNQASTRLSRYLGNGLVLCSGQVVEQPHSFLKGALNNYAGREKKDSQQGALSWQKVAMLGVAGGVVPCPDALAVLLVAISAGQVALGLEIIFFFSLGLAMALMLTGALFVLGGRFAGRSRRLALLANYAPYLGSIAIILLGILMLRSSGFWTPGS